MPHRRGSGRRANGSSSSSPNGPRPSRPVTHLAPALTKSAPPPAGLLDPESLDAEGKPSMAIDDFHAFGWSEKEIEARLTYPELRVDSMAQDPHDAHVTHEERIKHRNALEKQLKKHGLRHYAATDGNGKTKTTTATQRLKPNRDNIFIQGSDNWMLFDPLKGYAQDTDSEPPPAQYAKYERFKPGNRKIIAFNLVSKAVTLKTTPVEFIGYDVDYLPNGPKMIKEGEKKAARTQPARKTRGKGNESQSSSESPEGKEKEVAKVKEFVEKDVAPKTKVAPKEKAALTLKEAPKQNEISKVKEVVQVEEFFQEKEAPKQKEKAPPPTRRSPRSKKRSREAEEAEVTVEVEAPPKRRKVAVPKKKA